MNEFMILFHQEKFIQAIALGYYFLDKWLPNKYKRGGKDADARPSTQILNTIEVYMLHACSCLNETLIKLSENLEQPALKQRVVELLCTIIVACRSTMKSRSERTENTVRHNLKYSSEQFADVLEALGLASEFQKWMSFLDKLLIEGIKGDPVQELTIGDTTFSLAITEEQ